MKLSQYLADQGHPLSSGERLQVFLTNTLEPVEPQKNLLLPAVSREVEEAQKVKEKPILVITGNPPYSGHSKNKGAWISAAIDEYKFTLEKNAAGLDEKKPLGEKNSKWLQDDYVKFIRFAQMKMDGFTYKTKAPDGKPIEHSVPGVERGIVGVITNHSWLDNPTFRGMRQSLMRSFEQIYVLDLHGNAKKKERSPDGSNDQNVFDIEQGVSITILLKDPTLDKGVYHQELWGVRLHKYKSVAALRIHEMQWSAIIPSKPFYLFIRQTPATLEQESWRMQEIFTSNVLGFQSHRDHVAIGFDQSEIRQKLNDLLDQSRSNEEIIELYSIEETNNWKLSWARKRIANDSGMRDKIIKCAYRPFDKRWIYYDSALIDRPRKQILDYLFAKQNLVLGVGRFGNAIPERPWELATIASDPVDANIFRRGGVNLFPMWLYQGDDRSENFTLPFRSFLDSYYGHHYAAEEILRYIYPLFTLSPTVGVTRSCCASIFPISPFHKTRRHLSSFRALDGRLSRLTFSPWSYVETSPTTMELEITGSNLSGSLRPSSLSPLTRPRVFSQCRRLSGTFTSAAIRSSTNTSNPARAGSCRWTRLTTSPKSPTRSPSPSTKWRRSTTLIAPLFREWG